MEIFRIHFEDQGQDFLSWDVDIRTCKVVNSAPFQASIWTKCMVLNLWEIADHKEYKVIYTSNAILPDESREIMYPVARVEYLQIEEAQR